MKEKRNKKEKDTVSSQSRSAIDKTQFPSSCSSQKNVLAIVQINYNKRKSKKKNGKIGKRTTKEKEILYRRIFAVF